MFSLIITLTVPRIYREIPKVHNSDPLVCAFIYIIGCQAAPCSLFSQFSYPARPLQLTFTEAKTFCDFKLVCCEALCSSASFRNNDYFG